MLACRDGRNLFYTGPGGVGKSFVTQARTPMLPPSHWSREEGGGSSFGPTPPPNTS